MKIEDIYEKTQKFSKSQLSLTLESFNILV